MAIYFSPSTNGFYNSDLQSDYKDAGAWPDDLKEIADADYLKLLDGQASGLIILPDANGYPVLTEPVINWQQKAETQRSALISDAKETISLWQSELLLGSISDDDKESLTEWIAWIKALQALDLSGVTDEASYNATVWPDEPGVSA